MDDVSKIQQINNLARELMKHGQAKSMDEAISMAQSQVESGQQPAPPVTMPEAPSPDAPVVNSPEQPAAPAEEPLAPAPEQVPENIEAPAADMPNDEKVSALQDVLDRQQSTLSSVTGTINAYHKQFEMMNNKINGLIAEIASLKQAVEKLANSPVTPPLKPKQADAGQTQFKPENAPAPAPAPQPAPQQQPTGGGHARTGNFKSDDVSIEKFFYYGGK